VVDQRARRGAASGWYAQLAAGARFGDLRHGSITAPPLVMHGTEDRVVDPRNARLLADRIPHARLEMLPGLGHLFFWEAPEAFVDAVTRFALAPPPVAALPRKESS
jgi:3-oxoadipate enol-lactonase